MNLKQLLIIGLLFLGCLTEPDENHITLPSRSGFSDDSSIVAFILNVNGINPNSKPDSLYRSGYMYTYNIGLDAGYSQESGRLISLRMEGIGLTTIPPQIALLDSLRDLNISHNNITELPVEITLLNLLDSGLILHDNQLMSQGEIINKWIGKYTCEDWLSRQFTDINVSYHNDTIVIRHILDSSGFDSVSIKMVTHVKSSRIYGFAWPYYAKLITIESEWGSTNAFQPITNKILYVDSLSKCCNLVELNLNAGKLGYIPQDIYNLTKLQSLELVGNDLLEIDSSICNLSNLEYINFSSNFLTDLPFCITTLPNIRFRDYRNMDSFCWNYLKPSSQEVIDWLNLFGIDYWKSNQNDTINQ